MVTLDENVFPLAQAPKLLPPGRQGKRRHTATMFRWATIGLRGVVLETVQVGGTRCTSRAALERFFAALTAQATGNSIPARPQPQRPEVKAAERVLDAAGI
jgi:hypothetical protein